MYLLHVATLLAVCVAISVIIGAILAVVRFADRLGLTKWATLKWKAYRTPKPAPARGYSALVPRRRSSPIKRYPDAVADGEYAEQRLAQYEREGLRTRRAR